MSTPDNSSRFLQLVHEIGALASNASHLRSALARIAERIGGTLHFDVVSVYVYRPTENDLELVASHGLVLPDDHAVTLTPDEGLTGLVFSTGATQAFVPASAHPKYKYFPEIGEEKFEVYLGTPIQLGSKRYGVLVAQSTEKRAIEPAEEKLFEIVADRLAAALEVSEVLAHVPGQDDAESALEMYQGRGVSRGLALGEVFIIDDIIKPLGSAGGKQLDADKELDRVLQAFGKVETELIDLAQQFEAEFATEVATSDLDILQTQTYLLNDSAFRGQVEAMVKDGGVSAEAAIQHVSEEIHERFANLDDAYFRERADDILDIADRLLVELAGGTTDAAPKGGSVLLARRLGPAQLAAFAQAEIAGIVTQDGGANSHAAILARSLGIPAVTGVKGLLEHAEAGTRVLVDGRSGFVFLDPSEELVSEYSAAESQQNATIVFPALNETQTASLKPYQLMANISIPVDVATANSAKLDCVGLFRTELAFLHRSRPPTVMEQAAVYRDIAASFSDVVTIRTMDFGGDKIPVYLPFPQEENPLLGLRSIRHSMQNLQLLRNQMRAVVLTARDYPNVRVLLPMITQLWEVETAKDLMVQAATEIGMTDRQLPKLGVMLETPSLIFQLDQVAAMADFVSIGTNDFIQYLIAVDRYSESVGHLYSELHPGVVRALDEVLRRSRDVELDISVCGEMASRPRGALALAALGYRKLSLAPASAQAIRFVLANIDPDRLNAIRKAILQADRTSDVRAILDTTLDQVDPRLANL